MIFLSRCLQYYHPSFLMSSYSWLLLWMIWLIDKKLRVSSASIFLFWRSIHTNRGNGNAAVCPFSFVTHQVRPNPIALYVNCTSLASCVLDAPGVHVVGTSPVHDVHFQELHFSHRASLPTIGYGNLGEPPPLLQPPPGFQSHGPPLGVFPISVHHRLHSLVHPILGVLHMGSRAHQRSPSFRDFYGTPGPVLHVWYASHSNWSTAYPPLTISCWVIYSSPRPGGINGGPTEESASQSASWHSTPGSTFFY